ncbi:MAG: tripartite tricarboxylate transporter permease, partial [Betaproteobacteria bacterium]|nr:tripartite tricarboxylate transporter permease [Betaproteobacteria bacterium]
MDIIHYLLQGFSVALTPSNLLYCLIGVLWGTVVGVLPGLGPLAGMSLLLPLTFKLDPAGAIIMLSGIFYGAMYGGSTTSILLRIPGEAASIVTCIDGYEMAKQGRAGPALVIAAVGSFIGGTVSIVGLMLFAPLLAKAMLKVGPAAEFALMLLALIVMGVVSTSSALKTLSMILLGLLLATIGLGPI